MKIGITGATGYIGNKLLDALLKEGHRVTVLARKESRITSTSENLKIVIGDLSGKLGCLEELVQDIDILFHCAAETRNNAIMEEVNVQGTKNLTFAAKGKINRLVYLSSVGIYGSPIRGIFDEESKENPKNIYEKTKTKAEHLIKKYSQDGGYMYTILRPCKVMGVHSIDRDIFRLISYIDKGMFFYLGPAGASTNYIHVDNLINAMKLCAQTDNYQNSIYNLCDRRTLEELIEIISDGLERKNNYLRLPVLPFRIAAFLFGIVPRYPLNRNRLDGLTTRVVYNTSKIEKELGYRHMISIEEGLATLVKKWKNKKLKEINS